MPFVARQASPAMPRGPPAGLPSVIAAGFSGGSPVARTVRDRIEPALGTDLSGMRVHTGPAAAQAATSVGARAFTVGNDVVLGRGESPHDVALMAHEATHVVQQTWGRIALAREESEDDSWIPEAVLEEIRSLVRAVPGYDLVAIAIGQDPLTGRPVSLDLDNAVETLLLAGPFGPGVAAVLKAMDLLSSAWSVVTSTLAAHNVTITRVGQDIEAAWERLSIRSLPSTNAAMVRGYINAFLADIRAAISDLVDQLIAAVRAAVVPLVEPYLVEGALAPAWNLAIKVMHYNPLTGTEVNATTVEIIGDFLTLIGQDEVLAQMTERGTLQQTADWVDAQIATFLSLIGRASALFGDAWDAISPANLPNLLDTLPDLANRAVALFGDVVAFGSTLIAQVLVFVRDSLLNWLSDQAHGMRGFKLLTVILGRNPFTGAGVERTAENLIGGFIELIAGPDTYAQLAESGVIAEAAGRIESEMARLNISWELITGTFTAIWESLSLTDFLDPIGCITRVIDQFGEPLSRIVSFAATVVQVVLELILRLMNFPGDLLGSIIAGVQQALDNIQADPVGFLNNLLAALKQGFSQFFDNVLTHLVQGLADWLFRGLKGLGIEIPSELSGASILKLALDVMGLSVEFLWECLAEVIGPEKVALIRGAIDRLGQAWAFITDVQTRGMVAIWEYLSSQLGNLWDTILTMAKDWLVTNLIDAAIAKVLSMLDPTGVMAVINSCIAFYRAVQSVIEYVTEILQIVKTYVDTIAAIAAGNIAPGATMLEGGLAAAIPVAIGFLASQVGLGDIPEKIVEIINGLRQAIKAAVIWLIRQAMRLGEAALNALGLGSGPEQRTEEPADPNDIRDIAGQRAADALAGLDDSEAMDQALAGIRSELAAQGLTYLDWTPEDEEGVSYLEAAASPRKRQGKRSGDAPKTAGCRLTATLHFENSDAVQAVTSGKRFLDDNLPTGRSAGGSYGEDEVGRQKTALVGAPTSANLPGRGRNAGGGRGVVMIRPQEGATAVKVASWNSGFPVPATNDSHAERQFVDWLSSSKLNGLSRVEIDLTLSPCSICTAYLVGVQGGFQRKLTWRKRYYGIDRTSRVPHENCSTDEDLAAVTAVWPGGGPVAVKAGGRQRSSLSRAELGELRQHAYAHYEKVTA
ncbi:MAG: DUF4157 domain-containing protein [Propionicimonas sp.]